MKIMNADRDTNLIAKDAEDQGLEYLLSMFSDHDPVIINSVYIHCGKNVFTATNSLLEIFGGSSGAKPSKEDQKDLSTIACSLLHSENVQEEKTSNTLQKEQDRITDASCPEHNCQDQPESNSSHQPISSAPPFIPRYIDGKTPVSIKPLQPTPTPLAPLATFRQGPMKHRKQNKGIKKPGEQSTQNPNFVVTKTKNQVLLSDSSDSRSSLDSMDLCSGHSQNLLNRPYNPLDPLGLNALRNKRGEVFEDPKPQRYRNKPGRSGLSPNVSEQGKENKRSPALPPWAPPQSSAKKSSHPGSYSKNDQAMTTAGTIKVKGPKAVTDSHLQQPKVSMVWDQKADVARNRLVFRGVKSPVGILRSYILEKQPVMVILRGLPGSGKSYLARLLVSEGQKMSVHGVILSTDDFFMRNGNYVFNGNDLGEAHEWNRRRALQYVTESTSPIIIDNTNTTMWELLPYAKLALEYRYDVQIFEPDTPWKFKLGELARRNTHSVKKTSIAKMQERYERLTLEKVLAEAGKSLSKRKLSGQICSFKSGPPTPPASHEVTPEMNLFLAGEEVEHNTEKDGAVAFEAENAALDVLENETKKSTSNSVFLSAHNTTSSESFRSCFSDLSAVTDGKDDDSQVQVADTHPLSLLVEIGSPVLQGFARFQDMKPGSESKDFENSDGDLEPATPATIVEDDRHPFLNMMQDVRTSVGPRASSSKEFLDEEVVDPVGSHSDMCPDNDNLKERDDLTQSDSHDVSGERFQSGDDLKISPLSDMSEVKGADNAIEDTPTVVDSDKKSCEAECSRELPDTASSDEENLQQSESGKEMGSDKISLPSLVAYSDTDSASDPGVSVVLDLHDKEKQCSATEDSPGKEESSLQPPNAGVNMHTTNEVKTHDFENSREQSPQSSGATSPEMEGSPRPLTPLKHDVLPMKKKRVRVRKGRDQGPFLDNSLKERSKTENWGSFFTPSPGNAELDNCIVSDKFEHSSVKTKSVTCQCEPYMFSMVHKLNSPSFKSLQPVDDSVICGDDGSGLTVLSTAASQSRRGQQHMKGRFDADEPACGISSVPRKSETTDRSTSTDDALDQEQIDLQTLHNCFPEYTRQQLEEVMATCHNNVEWVTSHLLDSPALTDQDGGSDKESKGNEADYKNEASLPRNIDSRFNNPKTLAELSRDVVKNVSLVDSDDLEMQVIQAGQTRLQKIERHHRSRQHSSSSSHRPESVWTSDIRLEDFSGTVEPDEWWEWNQSPKSAESRKTTKSPLPPFQYHLMNASKPTSPQAGGGGLLASLMSEKKFSAPVSWQISIDDSSGLPGAGPLPCVDEETSFAAAAKPEHSFSSKPVVSREFIHSLETMFGSLGLAKNQDLVLDDNIAHKVYNCLKLQMSQSKIVTCPPSSHIQVQDDEALARALQEEEDLESRSTGAVSSARLPSQVQGWTSDHPSWMFQSPPSQQMSYSQSQNSFNSVSSTLHTLRGTSAMKKATPSKFQRNRFDRRAMPPGVGSAWAERPPVRGRHPDSLHTIIAEEEAAESVRNEQLQTLEACGEDLSTKIKRRHLTELFPTLAPDLLEEIFMQSNYALERTVHVLETTYNLSPTPAALKIEEAMVKKAMDISRKESPPASEQEDYSYLYDAGISTVSYDDLRGEAQIFRSLAKECQETASRHHRVGMHGAALFYRQRAKQYKEEEYEANHRAANFLFEKGSERLSRENTLDLHFYHLDEAIMAVNNAILMKEQAFRANPCKKNTYLNIVTGRGKNSKGGIPRLKPAVISHLKDRAFPFEERSAGMLRVHIGHRV